MHVYILMDVQVYTLLVTHDTPQVSKCIRRRLAIEGRNVHFLFDRTQKSEATSLKIAQF